MDVVDVSLRTPADVVKEVSGPIGAMRLFICEMKLQLSSYYSSCNSVGLLDIFHVQSVSGLKNTHVQMLSCSDFIQSV